MTVGDDIMKDAASIQTPACYIIRHVNLFGRMSGKGGGLINLKEQ